MGRRALADGIASGLALAGLAGGGCSVLGASVGRCSEWLFAGGVAMMLLSSLWALAGYGSPPGVISVFKGDAEVYPSAPPESLWVDRFVNVTNVWLTAGAVMVAISFLLVI